MRSLMIGWIPAKDATNRTSLYQPEPYQYISPKTADCSAMEGTNDSAMEAPDGSSKSLQLPAGWMLGMCLHY